MTERGQIAASTLGNGLNSVKEYAPLGYLQHHKITDGSGILKDYAYVFEPTTGNLVSRSKTDNVSSLTENFTYDIPKVVAFLKKNETYLRLMPCASRFCFPKPKLVWYNLDRLKNIGLNGQNITMNYAPSGNINSRSDVGTYFYGSTKPHAVVGIDNFVNPVPIPIIPQDISYTAFNKVSTIVEGINEADVFYGPDLERKQMQIKKDGALVSTKYYLGNYEKTKYESDQHTRELHYISSPDGLCAIYVKNSLSPNEDSMYYIHTDHLGSIALVSDKDGNVLEENSYDAWGRKRNATTWDFTGSFGSKYFDRGYTGHEMLPQFGLINMNGRMYDPLLGRMLSCDNYNQAPDNTQAYNRYSYCGNNPLKYTDPDGQLFGVDDAIGAGRGAITAYIGGRSAGLGGWELAGYTVAGAGLGWVSQNINPGYAFGSGFYLAPDIAASSHGGGIGIEAGYNFGFGHASASVNGSLYYSPGQVGTGQSGFYGRIGASAGLDFTNFGASLFVNSFFGGGIDQTIGGLTLGGGGFNASGNRFANLTYENDFPTGDWGDRYRTAAMRLDLYPFALTPDLNVSAGFNLFTGDPGLRKNDRLSKNGVYVQGANGENPDEFRAGIAYLGVGNFTVGRNSENIRNEIQNKGAHDAIGVPHFKVLDIAPSWFWNYGSGNSNSLWAY